jgi:hypothetical protein
VQLAWRSRLSASGTPARDGLTHDCVRRWLGHRCHRAVQAKHESVEWSGFMNRRECEIEQAREIGVGEYPTRQCVSVKDRHGHATAFTDFSQCSSELTVRIVETRRCIGAVSNGEVS